MKKILIYGDSNTWGDNFITGIRIPDEKQWPNILVNKLEDYKILQEGLPGRIAGNYEKDKKYKNGIDNFISTFRVNAPVDIVIIALGTNDLQLKYQKSSEDIINSLMWYKNIILEQFEDLDDRKKYFKDGKLPKIIYVAPPNFDYLNRAKNIFDENSEKKRLEIIDCLSKQIGNNLLVCNDMELFEDGIHLNYLGHEKMANLVEDMIKYE